MMCGKRDGDFRVTVALPVCMVLSGEDVTRRTSWLDFSGAASQKNLPSGQYACDIRKTRILDINVRRDANERRVARNVDDAHAVWRGHLARSPEHGRKELLR